MFVVEMADQGFNKIFVLIGICICIQLDVVLLQTPSGSVGDRRYFEMNTAGDLAVQMKYYGGTKLTIAVFYDGQSDSAKHFIGEQITSKLLRNMNQCQEINIVFSPCSILTGDTPNEADMIQICVREALPFDVTPMRDFIMCYFAAKKKDDVDACLNKAQMPPTIIKECVDIKAGTQICKTCNDDFVKAKDAKGEQFNAIEDFQGALCKVLKTGTLKCHSVCGE